VIEGLNSYWRSKPNEEHRLEKRRSQKAPVSQQKARETVDLHVNNEPTKRKVEERTQRRYNITTLSDR
jgi:hypothetical protein